jgi:hypothetical protein
MKVTCVQDSWPAELGGFLKRAKPAKKIEGLTEGKEYIGQMIAVVDRWGVALENATTITSEDYRFMIFNDDNKWCDYQLNLFEPGE